MGIDHLTVLDLGVDVGLVDLHHVQRARRLALPADVDQDQRVIAAHHLVGEVQSAGAEVGDLDAGRDLAAGQQLGHLAAEAVVAHPGVADAGDEDLLGCAAQCLGHTGSTSWGKKNRNRPLSRRSSWPGSSSTVTARWTRSSYVDVDALDRRPAAVEHPVIRDRGRSRDGARACRRSAKRDTVDGRRCARRGSPRAAAVRRRGTTSVRPLCSAMISSGPSASARSSMSPTTRSWLQRGLALLVGERVARAARAPPRSRCCRTGCRGCAARSAGGRAARSPLRARRRRPRSASTGQMFTLSRPASSGETKRPAETSTSTCTEISDSRSAAARSRPGGHVGGVVHAGAHAAPGPTGHRAARSAA